MKRYHYVWILLLVFVSSQVLAFPTTPLIISTGVGEFDELNPVIEKISVTDVGNNQVCLLIQVLDIDRIIASSSLALIDSELNRVVWQRTLPPPAGAEGRNSHAISCVAWRDKLYVAANIGSQNLFNASSEVHMYTFDRLGNLLAETTVSPRNKASFFLGWLPDTSGSLRWLVGRTEYLDDNKGLFSTSILALRTSLRSMPARILTLVRSRAYTYEEMKFYSGDIFLVGSFFKAYNARVDADSNSYVVSRLDPKGHHLWSVYPKMPLNLVFDAVFTIGPDADTYALNSQGSNDDKQWPGLTFLSEVTAAGQIIPIRKWPGEYCYPQALAASSSQLFLISKHCRSEENREFLVAIDPKTLKETTLEQNDSEPQALQVLGDRLWVGGVNAQGAVVVQQFPIRY